MNSFTGDPFVAGPGGISAAQDTFLALSTPNGSKYYFIGRSATDTVVATDQNYQVVNRRSLGTGATAAMISPDGSKLYVLAGSVYVLSTANDQIISQFSAGTNPNDLALSRDGSRLYVTSSGGTLTALDANNFSVLNTLNVGPATGVGVGPNGLVYVSSTNILYEIDPVSLTLRNGAGIQLNGVPGKPVFVGDQFGNLKVVMANSPTSAALGLGSLLTVDVASRTYTAMQTGGVAFDKVVPVSGTRAFATSTSGTLYDITLPGSAVQAQFSGLSTLGNVKSIAASNEFPQARYLYVATTGTNQLVRVDLASNSVSGTLGLTGPPGNVVYTGAAYTGTPSSIYLYNNGQFIAPGTQSLPLVVRALDASGHALQNVPVTFTTNAFGAFMVTQSTQFTDPDGYAQGIVIAPTTTGAFQVIATVGSGTVLTGTFNLNSGTGSQGASGAISARSGNGQVVREAATTPEFLRVVVRDTAGNPVPNAIVNWTATTLNGPTGSLTYTQTVTDFAGESTNTYTSPLIGPNLNASYIQTTITASTFSGSVNFYVTVIPIQFGQNLAALPTVTLVTPTSTEQTISYRAGTTATGAIQVRVTAGSGPQAGSPIPNVGISATTGLDPNVAPSARCADNTGLTDSTGFATCDLVIGNKIGEGDVVITSGGQTAGTIHILVTPGLPGKINATQGDGQAGPPGSQLPLALVAQVQDSFGNNLPNVDVTWTVEAGSATLVNPITRSDTNSRVSTLVRLGATPGAVRIKVTAQGGLSTATATYNLTVNLTATTIQRISGDGQTAIVGTAFGAPLVAQLLDANGSPVPGVAVNFSINGGSGVLSANSATTDAQGRASINVTAGQTAGPLTISATFGNNSVNWTLTVAPLGPAFSESDITDYAGGSVGIAPGAIVKISGRNIVPSVSGTVFPALLTGPLPTTLGGVRVTFGGIAAPIFYVTNTSSAGEAVVVQVPYEVQENTSVPVTISSGNASSTVNVTAQRVLPGILETTDASGNRYAMIVRADGSFVTPSNPIGRGEQARVYMTGLGRTTAAASTNTPGAGQRVNGNVVIGINDAGVRVISATLAPNLIGVYEVLFEVPSDAATGTRNFGAFIEPGGGAATAYANGSTITIR